jgi:S-adenosyl-L-methionine hydrolase (adenosine-forming)
VIKGRRPGLIISLLFFAVLLLSLVPACAPAKVDLPVVLFSDFGSDSYRIAQLKGIILSHDPDARLIDACHGVPSFDINTGAFMLFMSAREFPGHFIFIAVVDPYTQKEPRYLVLETGKGQVFIAPDNGVLTYIIRDGGIKSLYKISNPQLFDQPIARLSAEHVEGVAGARLASGYRLQDLGETVTDPLILDIQQPEIIDNRILGTVVFVDNFGNCITNILLDTASRYGLGPGDYLQVQNPSGPVPAKFGTIYSDVAEGREIVFVNRNLGVVQLSINMGSYSEKYGLQAGDKIGLQKTGAAQ